jgi:hypothetical protein
VSQLSPALRASALLLAGAMLAGCGGSEPEAPPVSSTSAASAPQGSPSPAAANRAPSFDDVKAAIAAQGEVGAYSTTFTLVTQVNGKTLLVMSGRMNVEGPVAGKVTMRLKKVGDQQAGVGETVFTAKTMYVRAGLRRPVTGPWQRSPMTKNDVAPSLQDYAEVMLEQGPKVMKKQQRLKGIATTRLSGRIKIAEIEDFQPSLYKQLRSVGTNDIGVDLWVDRRGRVLRLEQRLKIGPQRLHNTMIMKKFQRPMTVRAPV